LKKAKPGGMPRKAGGAKTLRAGHATRRKTGQEGRDLARGPCARWDDCAPKQDVAW